jgi:TonB-linked SusC/RagA family outer membrane protein
MLHRARESTLRFNLCKTVLLLLLIFMSEEGKTNVLQTKFSFSGQNVPLREAFDQVKKISGLSVFYSNQILDDKKRVSYNFKNASLDAVMITLLKDLNVGYELKNQKIIVLIKVPVALNKTSQEKTREKINGKVFDSSNKEPLMGVLISIKNSAVKTATNVKGEYTINVYPEDVIVFSFLGFASQEISGLSLKKSPDIHLKTKSSELSEVVVVAYGEQKRKDLTGSVAEVNLKELQKAPVSKFEDALAGRIAGVSVNSDDGQPGSEMNIVIRGGNSLTQSNAPLYVIDGFPSEEAVGNMVSPNDIESITVLKDASATAIYGSRGANGVVIIETKKAKAGLSTISYNASTGFQKNSKIMELMGGYEFVKYQMEVDSAELKHTYFERPGRTLEDYRSIPGVNWQNLLFETSKINIHDFSISGGNQNAKYRFSGAVYDQNGVIINTGYKRYHGRAFIEQTLSKKFKATFNINANRQINYGEQVKDGNYSSNLMFAIWGYRPVGTGMDNLEESLIDDLSSDLRVNPYLNAKNAVRDETSDNIWANVRLNYNFTPKLDLTVSGVYNNKIALLETFSNSKTSSGYPFPNNMGRLTNGSLLNTYGVNYLNENILKYRTRINVHHNLELLGGFTVQYNIAKINGFAAKLVPNEDLGISVLDQGDISSMTSKISDNALSSFLSRVNYNYKSKYLATLSFRADGSSKFIPGNRWGYFPSGSIAWNMAEENFMKNISSISNSKIRMSYGVTGNNRVSDYAYMTALAYQIASYYSFNNEEPAPGMIVSSLGNSNLKWESTHQLDIGYDLSLFRNKLNFTFDYYKKNTKDLLISANLPYSTGISSAFKNVGQIKNEGFEFSVNTLNIKTNRFQWNSDFNISFNKNKILALSENQTKIETSVVFPTYTDRQILYLAEIGGPAAVFYGYNWLGNYQVEDFNVLPNGKYELKPEVATNGNSRASIQPGDIKYEDINGDKVVNLEDRVKLGTALPKHFGGLNNTFQYDNFSLSVFLQWSYGNKVFNANRMIFEGNFYNVPNLNQYKSYENRWTPENPNNELFRTGGFGPRGMLSSRTLEDGSFLRLKTISAAYALPDHIINRLKIKSLQISATAQNLFTWTKYSGADPEVSIRQSALTPGFDYLAYPRATSIVFGLKLGL